MRKRREVLWIPRRCASERERASTTHCEGARGEGAKEDWFDGGPASGMTKCALENSVFAFSRVWTSRPRPPPGPTAALGLDSDCGSARAEALPDVRLHTEGIGIERKGPQFSKRHVLLLRQSCLSDRCEATCIPATAAVLEDQRHDAG